MEPGPHVKTRGWIAADPLAAVATALLGLVAVWSIALSILVPAPPAPALLTDPQKHDTQRLVVLVASPGDEARARSTAAARADVPRLPVRVIPLRPDRTPRLRGARADRRLWSLLHAYGYDDLPVLLVLDGQGQVVRVSDF
jgi:hypothetical protein